VEGKKSIWPSKISGRGVRMFNKEFLVFAFFLFLSFIFWYLNALRKEIEVDLKYPVKYINAPRDRNVGSEAPAMLSLNLRGPGYSIVMLKISGNRAPLVIDFSKVTWKKVPESKNPEYFIVSNQLIANFSKQLNSEFQIVWVKPDTLFFTLQKKVAAGQGSKTGGGEKK
jgi:hypothetical protein